MNWWQLLVSIGSIIAFWFLIHRENQSILRDIAKEQKDFHGRLCTLEQKYISMMEKHIERLGK
jgi:hypothetical protein